jgi:hypothetical protein
VWAVRVNWAARKGAGPAQGKGELGRAGWAAAVGVWAGFQAGLGFLVLGFLFLSISKLFFS